MADERSRAAHAFYTAALRLGEHARQIVPAWLDDDEMTRLGRLVAAVARTWGELDAAVGRAKEDQDRR